MQSPESLKKGDKIGIVAPARKISLQEIRPTINKLKKWGLEVVLGNNMFNECNQYSGTDEERLTDFRQMLDDDSIRAILCARGGYGTVRIIDKIDFRAFKERPKWIVGFSDITVLHSHIHSNFCIETVHSIMPVILPDCELTEQSYETMRKVLFGERQNYEIEASPLSRKGIARGVLTGGNLSILYSLTGTKSDINTNDKILFIEDLDEYLYHIDRMMMNFKRSGKLENLAGLIVGGMGEMNDNDIPFGKTAQEIIAETVAEYNYPVVFDFPAGHIKNNMALILGREILLRVDKKVYVEFSETNNQ